MDNNINNDNNFFMNEGDYADYHYCSTPERGSDDEFDEEAEISLNSKLLITDLRRTTGGFIVNSSAYISDENWNTLVVLEKNVKRIFCALCDLYINIENSGRHVDTAGHKTNLTANKPLKRFELSITRKIARGYHCGVCNVVFEDPSSHYDTKNHSEKMLSAINKANDILYDNDCHAIPNSMKLPDSNPKYDSHGHTNNFATKNDNFVPENGVNGNGVNGNGCNGNGCNGNGCSGNGCNGNGLMETIWEPTISYAEMAKLKQKVPKELKIDLGDKLVTVKYDCWNMIVYTSGSSFYCMACQVTGVRRVKIDHCSSDFHVARLKKCSVVKAYETHLIRRVGDKLYHCGHCNNLQPINEMEIHVEQKHPKFNFKLDKDKLQYEHCIEIAQIKERSFDDNVSEVSNGNRMEMSELRPIVKSNTSPLKSPTTVQFQNVPTQNFVPIKNPPNHVPPMNSAPSMLPLPPNHVPNENFQPIYVPNENHTQRDTEFILHNADKVKAKLVPTKNGHENGQIQHVLTDNNTPVFSFVPFTVPPPNFEQKGNGFIEMSKKSERTDQRKIFNQSIMLTSQFGFQIYVNVEAFNTIVKFKDVFMCLVCDMSLTDANVHIVENLHVEMLQRVNFIPEFTCNLIRMLRNKLHCVICNTTTVNDRSAILNHIATYEHGLLLRKALFLSSVPTNFEEPGFGVCKYIEPVPPPETHIFEPPPEFQTEQPTDVENEIDPDLMNRQFEYRSIIIKLRNIYLKVAEDAWHTVVFCGDGKNYCFACGVYMFHGQVYKHMNSKAHFRSLDEHGVLDMYGINVIRQMENVYHCAFCNVIVTRKYLEQHLKWPPHKLNAEIALSTDRRSRECDRAMGIPEIEALPVPEKYNGLTDCTKNTILYNVKILKKRTVNNEPFHERRTKIVIFNNNVFKIKFECWNGFVTAKDKFRCIICNVVFKKTALESHYLSKTHSENLGRPFFKLEAYGLVRELSDSRRHCVICNIELSKADNITEHASGKKHKKNVQIVENDASETDCYDECDDEPFIV